MKRLGMLLVLISVGMFALGCTGDKKDTKKAGDKGGAAAPAADTKAGDTKEEPKK